MRFLWEDLIRIIISRKKLHLFEVYSVPYIH